MSNPVSNTIPSLQQLAVQAMGTNPVFSQDTLECPNLQETPSLFGFSYNFVPPHASLEVIKGVWDSFKISFGPNSVMQKIEKSLITECCQKFGITYCCLSYEDKEILLIKNMRLLFQRLCQELNVPVITLETCSTLQKQWEEEALFILWNKGICPQLGENAPQLFSIEEIRAWLANPDHAVYLNQITEIDLSDCGLKAIPSEIQHLSHLTQLILNHNQIKCIPDFLGKLAFLTILCLADNKISCIPDSIALCKNLQILNLHTNSIITVSNKFCELTHLVSLHLSNNQISYLPKHLFFLAALYDCDLSKNPLFMYMDDRRGLWKGLTNGGAELPCCFEAVQNFFIKADALNSYECQGAFSKFVKFIHYAYSIDRHDLIKTAYETLSDKDKDLICRAFFIQNCVGKIRTHDDEFWENDFLFKDMNKFCIAVVSAITGRHGVLSQEQKDYVATRLLELGKDMKSAHILLLSDLMAEMDPTNLKF